MGWAVHDDRTHFEFLASLDKMQRFKTPLHIAPTSDRHI